MLFFLLTTLVSAAVGVVAFSYQLNATKKDVAKLSGQLHKAAVVAMLQAVVSKQLKSEIVNLKADLATLQTQFTELVDVLAGDEDEGQDPEAAFAAEAQSVPTFFAVDLAAADAADGAGYAVSGEAAQNGPVYGQFTGSGSLGPVIGGPVESDVESEPRYSPWYEG